LKAELFESRDDENEFAALVRYSILWSNDIFSSTFKAFFHMISPARI
jgi:hypothetical protein